MKTNTTALIHYPSSVGIESWQMQAVVEPLPSGQVEPLAQWLDKALSEFDDRFQMYRISTADLNSLPVR